MNDEQSGSRGPDLFPQRLRHARAELRKLSQSELAELAKMPSSSVAHFEGGARKPSFDNLKALAVALDVSTDFLLGRVDEPGMTAARAADPLFRHVQNISHQDRPLAEDFLRLLAERNTKSGG
jgi:transcriptional regulator with XRE-family HTH domain